MPHCHMHTTSARAQRVENVYEKRFPCAGPDTNTPNLNMHMICCWNIQRRFNIEVAKNFISLPLLLPRLSSGNNFWRVYPECKTMTFLYSTISKWYMRRPTANSSHVDTIAHKLVFPPAIVSDENRCTSRINKKHANRDESSTTFSPFTSFASIFFNCFHSVAKLHEL